MKALEWLFNLSKKAVTASSIIYIFLVLVIAGALSPTIMATFANSTYTGLSGPSATLAGLIMLFVIIAIVMWIVKRK